MQDQPKSNYIEAEDKLNIRSSQANDLILVVVNAIVIFGILQWNSLSLDKLAKVISDKVTLGFTLISSIYL